MSEPEVTPAEEQVRRLLADARHTEPMPDDVAARLDEVLADLHEEPAPRRTHRVADLATARRRHNARTWLVAAAAAVAIGIGINQLDLSVSSNDDSASGGSAADRPELDAGGDSASEKPSASVPEAAGAGAAPQDSTNDTLTDGLSAAGPSKRLDPDRFGADVRRLGRSTDASATESQATYGLRQLAKSCAVPAGPGRLVAVRYDGQRGVLVYRPVQGETQVVDLFLCGSDEPTRSITLPAP